MCIVTFVPLEDGVAITSNRDEWMSRGTAWRPCQYVANSGVRPATLVYPMDPDRGGTWIAAKDNGDAVVLLNGAFHPHTRDNLYRQSRGTILLEILNGRDSIEGVGITDGLTSNWFRKDLTGVEPFTLVLFSAGQLHECRWDGTSKHKRQLSVEQPHIWSSVTLYDAFKRQQHTNEFHDWFGNNLRLRVEDVMQFHQQRRLCKTEDNSVTAPGDHAITVSITSIHLNGDHLSMFHSDLHAGSVQVSDLVISSAASEKKN